jgi:predicted AAA+ superfamily ATPase
MIDRRIRDNLVAALGDTRVVLLNGARQTGKSTLARAIAEEHASPYLSLDDPAVLGLARSDSFALVSGQDGLVVIDEVQHAPELFPAIKRIVDSNSRPGQFLLTGSANIFLLPKLAESLAGRMEILPLHPLSQSELSGSRVNLVEALFSGKAWGFGKCAATRADVCQRIVAGGFPEAIGRAAGERRNAWFRSYIAALLQRDVRDLVNINKLTDLPRLLGLLAARTASLMNIAEISRAVGIPHSTLQRYLALLEATFLFQPLPAWSANLGKRLVKSPKIHLLDSGLVAYLRGESDARGLGVSPSVGPFLESFVVQEIRKQLAWSLQTASAWHFRTATGSEVDLLLEAPDGRVVGFEVKAAGNVGQNDFKGLRALAEALGERFVAGAVLYLGEQILPFGDGLQALPVSVLWQAND